MDWRVNKKIAPKQIKTLKMTQFPGSFNNVITRHTLQYQTNHHMIIGAWNYRCQDWFYVVLSRVKSLNVLLLINKLNDDLTKFRISDDLVNGGKSSDGLDKTF